MKSNNKDTFEGSKFINIPKNNFFINEEASSIQYFQKNTSEPMKRLNDYDSNILQDGAYRDINNELLKLEFKISRLEEEIKKTEEQIVIANEINDFYSVNDLNTRKIVLTNEYNKTLSIYNNKSISARISNGLFGIITNPIKHNFSKINSFCSTFFASLLNKLPENLTSVLELKQSLIKLKNLNKTVDDLMSSNVPYGENFNKYEQLSKYIIKSNSIQKNISKHIKQTK